MDEVSQELRRSEAKNVSLSNDLKKAEQAVDAAHKECVSLKTKLQELEKSLVDSDKSTQQMEEKLKVMSSKFSVKEIVERRVVDFLKKLDNFKA